VVWKLDRLSRSLPHLLSIVTELKARDVAFRSLTEQMDTTTPHGELLFLGVRHPGPVRAGTDPGAGGGGAGRRQTPGQARGPTAPALSVEQVEQITAALNNGASKAAACRTFKVPRSTLIDTDLA